MPALQTGKTGAQGTAMTHSLAQNGSLDDLHFPALNAKGCFCPDKNDCGSISWEFTAGQGENPAHTKCYWLLETHLSIRETSSTNNPGTTENVFAFLWIRFLLEWVPNEWLYFGSCRFSQPPTDGYIAIIYLGLGYIAIRYLGLIFGAQLDYITPCSISEAAILFIYTNPGRIAPVPPG